MDYNSYSAIVNKVLQQDGATTDFDGNMIYPPNEQGAKKWEISPPIAAKFLNSDGAISNTLGVTVGEGGGLSSVTHDSTLTGNGSAGSPLGVNISGLIDGNDKILSSSANGFLSSLSLEHDTETGIMTLAGKNGEVLSTINLPLESFLENAAFDNTTNILTFSWNTESGIEDMEVDLSGLIQTYTAGDGLVEDGGEFRVVIDGNETRLRIDPTSKGLKIDLTDIKTKLDGIEAGAQVNSVTSVAGKSGAVTLTKSDIGLGSVDDTADIDKTVKNASYLVADDSELGTWFTGGTPSMIVPHIGGFGNVTVPTAPPTDAGRGPLPNYGSEMKYVTQALGNSGKYVQLAYSPDLTRAFMRSFNGTSLTAWVELFTVNSPEIKLDAARAIYVDADGAICARAGADSVFKISTYSGLNVGIGSHSLETLNGGDRNSAIGWYTLSNTANGSQNSAIGYDAGGRLADNATPQENVSNSVFLGARTHGATSDGVTNTIVIGYNAASQGSNSITLGNSSITKLSCQVTAITALSDSRLKEEISPADLSMCLDAVMNLPVSRYKYKNFTGTHIDEHVTGWLADDVSAVFPKSVSVCDKIFPLLDSDGEQLYEEDGETPRTFLMENVKEITMTEAVPTLWGAVQALAARVAALEAQLNQ